MLRLVERGAYYVQDHTTQLHWGASLSCPCTTMSQSPVKKEEPAVKTETKSGPMTEEKPVSATPEWNVISLKACTQEELQDTRHHILKFHTKQDVDIMKNFNRPVRMHRKDPQNIQFQLSRQEMDRRRQENQSTKVENGQNGSAFGGENGEGEEVADMSQVAPDGGARRHRKNLFKRKTKQVHIMDEKKRKLRYEEYYPWVIEDYTGDNVFVGSYEAGSTECTQVLFVFDKNCFKMVPTEKVYKFTPRNKYATLTLEEAEARMEKNSSAPRWLMKHMDDAGSENGDVRFRRANGGATSRPLTASNGPGRMRTVQGSTNDRDSDHDDLDFDEEFADDEEAPIMDGDEEENKLLEKKIKKDMLKAANFEGQPDGGVASDDDLNDLFEVEKSRKVDKEGKKLKKVLNRTEGGVYESDDEDVNPYVSQSDLESENDSDNGVTVKAEPEDGVDSGLQVQRPRTIFISRSTNGTIVITAPSQFLRDFPPGEWNPYSKKRSPAAEPLSPAKKIKREESTSVLSMPVEESTVDINDAGPNGELVTTAEVLGIVRNNPLTTKELLLKLKSRISTHKDNRLRIIRIVKLNLKLVDGKLEVKE